MGRRQRSHPPEKRLRRMHKPHGQVLIQRSGRQLGEGRIVRQQRFYFGGKGEPTILLGVKERLLAEVVSRQQQAMPGPVP
jgi:hypothetical protein